MRKLFLLFVTLFALSCGSREDEPIVPKSDGYVTAPSSILHNTIWKTYQGENPPAKLSFWNATVSVTVNGTYYPQQQIYYKGKDNMAGEFYVKVNDIYAKVYMVKDPAYPYSDKFKIVTFSGFPGGAVTYEMHTE